MAMPSYSMPPAQTPFLDANGYVNPPWYLFIAALLQSVGGPLVVPGGAAFDTAEILASMMADAKASASELEKTTAEQKQQLLVIPDQIQSMLSEMAKTIEDLRLKIDVLTDQASAVAEVKKYAQDMEISYSFPQLPTDWEHPGKIGAASPNSAIFTTVNKYTLTQPANGSTLTILDGKTFTANNTLTLAGTDGTTMTFPTTSATLARTDAGNTFNGNQVVNGTMAVSVVSGSAMLQLIRTTTVAGSGWIGADGNYAFRVFDAAFADRFRVAQNSAVTDLTSAGVASPNFIANAATSTAAAGQLAIGTTTATTVGAAGTATALPANPLGYLVMNLAGTNIKLPYYNN